MDKVINITCLRDHLVEIMADMHKTGRNYIICRHNKELATQTKLMDER